jgi:hypothetical protein
MHKRLLCLLAMAAMACSSSPTQSVPPSFVSVTAADHVAASADGTYTWGVTFTYSDADDYATALKLVLTRKGISVPAQWPLDPAALTQTRYLANEPATLKGYTYDYTLVLEDQSGLESAPYTGTVTFD